MEIIGLCGLIGSGKSTVGNMLKEAGYQPASFAETLKDATSAIFGWSRPLLEGDTEESRTFRETVDPYWSEALGYEITPRMALQKVGTEAGRNVFGESLWVASVLKKMKNNPTGKFVITDVRFVNEVKSLQNLGGKIYEVIRTETTPEWFDVALRTKAGVSPKHERMEVLYPNVHISEWDLIATKKDGIIWNNKDLDSLKKEVHEKIISKSEVINETI